MGQTQEICPADKKMYALRDVTGTIESIPLICSSIMSKKIAEGIEGLVLDVKFGNGAFMKNIEDAQTLGRMLIRIGEHFGINTNVVFSNMNQPLGKTAGRWCEVQEAIDSLQGKGPDDTMEITFELGSHLLQQAKVSNTRDEAISIQKSMIESGKAFDKFLEMVETQGGNPEAIEQNKNIHTPLFEDFVSSNQSGFISSMDTFEIGMASITLGCGRIKTTDIVDPTAGIEFLKKTGEEVQNGEAIIRCFNSSLSKLQETLKRLDSVIQYSDIPKTHTLIH